MAARTRTRTPKQTQPETEPQIPEETMAADTIEETPEIPVEETSVEETPAEDPFKGVNPFADRDPMLSINAQKYLDHIAEIEAHNKYVAELERHHKENLHTPGGLLGKAKAWYTNGDERLNNELRELLDKYDALQEEVTKLTRAAAEKVASIEGVEIAAEKPKPSPDRVEELRSKRATAQKIGQILADMVALTGEPGGDLVDTYTNFLRANPVPAIGRDSSWTASSKLDLSSGGTGAGSPKYRIRITAYDADGEIAMAGKEPMHNLESVTKAVNAAAKRHGRRKDDSGKTVSNGPSADHFRRVFEENGKSECAFEYGEGSLYTRYVLTPHKG